MGKTKKYINEDRFYNPVFPRKNRFVRQGLSLAGLKLDEVSEADKIGKEYFRKRKHYDL